MTRLRYLCLSCAILLLPAILAASGREDPITERPPWAGFWFNTFGRAFDLSPYNHFLAGEAGRLQWEDLQTGPGSYEDAPNAYDFSEIGEVLQRVNTAGHYYYCELWTGHWHTPEWVYSKGVPRVLDVEGSSYPYYVDPDYHTHLSNFFNALATYIAGLDQDLRERIAFIQPGFGSTGDRQLYKADLQDPQYAIDSDAYIDYMRNTTLAWYAAFDAHPKTANIRFLWNINDYDGLNPSKLNGVSERLRGEMIHGAWMKENYNCQLRKQQFTPAIGYMVVNEKSQDDEQRPLFYGTSNPPRWGGNAEFVRGEFNDARWANVPMVKVAPKWQYYWTAISSVDRGLDAWETNDRDSFFTGDNFEAFAFSHRHAYYKRPQTSPYAFIALRDVLDYSDGQRFPTSEFGGGSVTRNNPNRIQAIVDAYAVYGAANDDTAAVINYSQNKYLELSTGLNDVVWNVIDRNYRRHMFQIDPNGTSVGWWRVGSKDDPYGRFARAFESSTGKNEMAFRFVDGFIDGKPELVEIKVIYYDEFAGSTWELRYDSGGPALATAASVTCTGDANWKTLNVTLTDAEFAPGTTDLALVNTDSLDDKFHLIEVKRMQDFEAFAKARGLLGGRDGDDDRDGVPNFYEFFLGGDPQSASDVGFYPRILSDGDELLHIHHRRLGTMCGLFYDLETSENLMNWSPVDEVLLDRAPVNDTMEAREYRFSKESLQTCFFRLKVSE